MDVSVPAETMNSFLHLFALSRPSTDWMMSTCTREGHLLYLAYYSFLEAPSQTREIMFYQLPGHLLAQIDIKLTISIKIRDHFRPGPLVGYCWDATDMSLPSVPTSQSFLTSQSSWCSLECSTKFADYEWAVHSSLLLRFSPHLTLQILGRAPSAPSLGPLGPLHTF